MRLRVNRPGYLVFTAVFACLALAFGGPVAIGTLWFWLLMGVADLVWGLIVAAQTAILYHFHPGNFTAGDPLEVELQIANDGWLHAPTLTLRDGPGCALGFGTGPHPERYSLPPLARLELQRTLPARRGQYRLGPVELGAQGPFGLFSWVRDLYSEREITVLPRLRPLPFWPLEQAEAYGRAVQNRSPFPDPTLVVSTRPMLPGDSPRRIHWNRTARTGSLQVREIEPSSGGHGIVVLDLWGPGFGRGRDGYALDAATEIAAAVGHAILRSGASLTFLGTAKVPLRLHRAHGAHVMGELLDLLATAQADGVRSLRDWIPAVAAEVPSRAVVVLVTPTTPSSWAAQLPLIQVRGATVAAVLAIAAPAAGDVFVPAVADLHRVGCRAWAAASAEQLAERVTPPGVRRGGRAAPAGA